MKFSKLGEIINVFLLALNSYHYIIPVMRHTNLRDSLTLRELIRKVKI